MYIRNDCTSKKVKPAISYTPQVTHSLLYFKEDGQGERGDSKKKKKRSSQHLTRASSFLAGARPRDPEEYNTPGVSKKS